MAEIAVVHFANRPKGQSRAGMAAVMAYTMREEKTKWQGQQLVSGINCRPETAYDDFLRTKLLYHKDSGTMYYHMIQSFPKGEKVDPVTAHTAALKLAEYFRDHDEYHRRVHEAGPEQRTVPSPDGEPGLPAPLDGHPEEHHLHHA